MTITDITTGVPKLLTADSATDTFTVGEARGAATGVGIAFLFFGSKLARARVAQGKRSFYGFG
jgi:hypothetical protein